jgi:putative transposase
VGAPSFAQLVLAERRVGKIDACTILFLVPKRLKRFHGGGEFHFITCSCYHRRQFLKSGRRRDLFLKILEEVRNKYKFIVSGYVVMPEHFHLLIGEPPEGGVSTVMQVLKQRVARKMRSKRGTRNQNQRLLFEDNQPPQFWQVRYYDFNVYSRKKYVEKLNYMHNNPVKRGLVSRPEEWTWSSYRFYAQGIQGLVTVTP